MKLIVTSDTHNKLTSIKKLITFMDSSYMLVHLGDCTRDVEKVSPLLEEKNISFANVRGNCDFSGPGPYREIVVEGKRIGLVHGHQQNVGYSLTGLDLFAREKELDAILYGHTHISRIEYGTTGILLFNPGSMSEPRLGKASFGILEVSEEGIVPRVVAVEDMEKAF